MRLLDRSVAVPNGWSLLPLAKAGEFCNSLRIPLNDDYRRTRQGRFPYYGPTGVVDWIDEYRAEGVYTLLGEDGDHFLKWSTWPMTHLTQGKFTVNNHAHLIRGTQLCTTEWLYQFFFHRDLRRVLTLQGAGRLKLTRHEAGKLLVLVPPIEEQIPINQVLSACDASVRTVVTLVKVRRKLKRGLLQQLLSGQRRFPEFEKRRWVELRVSDVLQETFRPVVWDDETEYRLASIRRSSKGLFDRGCLLGRQIKVKKLNTIRTNDFLISHIQAAYGAMGLVPEEFDGAKVSDMYTVLTPKAPESIDMRFLNFLSQRKEFRHMAYLSSNGFFAERLRLNFDPRDFMHRKLLLPPTIEEQSKIADVLATLDDEIASLIALHDALKEQKKGLMQKLLTGQVRVPASMLHSKEVHS